MRIFKGPAGDIVAIAIAVVTTIAAATIGVEEPMDVQPLDSRSLLQPLSMQFWNRRNLLNMGHIYIS